MATYRLLQNGTSIPLYVHALYGLIFTLELVPQGNECYANPSETNSMASNLNAVAKDRVTLE